MILGNAILLVLRQIGASETATFWGLFSFADYASFFCCRAQCSA
jgi:hypothetical protein